MHTGRWTETQKAAWQRRVGVRQAVAVSSIRKFRGPAGGWQSLRSVAAHLRKQDVAVKGAKTLLSMNQPDGFDCPGCAWPDRDHTSTFEFCENGAKAVAAESTRHRAGPELFARYTVAELAAYSDHWLEGRSEEHTSELQSRPHLVCRLLLEK